MDDRGPRADGGLRAGDPRALSGWAIWCLDFGCGLGILGMMAARAGARKVYAVDRLPIVRLAHAIAQKNGLGDIGFVYAPEPGFELPEKVDVLVSEWLGHFALQEGILGPLCAARDTHLRPGGRMIPAHVTLKTALVCDRSYHETLRYFHNRPYGFDFSPAAEWVSGEVLAHRFTMDELLTPVAIVAELDMATISGLPVHVEGEIVPDREAEVYGIAGWFEADLGSGVKLDTGPAAPDTHWKPLFFPFAEPLQGGPFLCACACAIRRDSHAVAVVGRRWSIGAVGGRPAVGGVSESSAPPGDVEVRGASKRERAARPPVAARATRPRDGWAEAARRLHAEVGDQLLDPPSTDFEEAEWQW